MNPLIDLIKELKQKIEKDEEVIKILKDEIMKKKYYIQGLEYSQNPKNENYEFTFEGKRYEVENHKATEITSSQKPPIKNNGK